MPRYEKIVLVTKKTALEELTERFNTPQQAVFFIRQSRAIQEEREAAYAVRERRNVAPRDTSLEEYRETHDTYHAALDMVTGSIPKGVRLQVIERSFLPTYTFGPEDLVVTLGPDGLVVNAAKYVDAQPVLAVNPDPARFDGVLIPFNAFEFARVVGSALEGRSPMHRVSMAKAELDDGQTLYAVNDLFIGMNSHVSARYRIAYGEAAEDQSSSGIIVSTGAGSTGWFRSVLTGAAAVVHQVGQVEEAEQVREKYAFDWESDYLYYSVREPFVSRTSSASMAFGRIDADRTLDVISQMPQNGVIFGDGIEADYVAFNSGSSARIGLAERRLSLVARSANTLNDTWRHERPPNAIDGELFI